MQCDVCSVQVILLLTYLLSSRNDGGRIVSDNNTAHSWWILHAWTSCVALLPIFTKWLLSRNSLTGEVWLRYVTVDLVLLFGTGGEVDLHAVVVVNQGALLNAYESQTVASSSGCNPSCVLMMYGMEPSKFNCQRVFNLLCIYGNVIKVTCTKEHLSATLSVYCVKDNDNISMHLFLT